MANSEDEDVHLGDLLIGLLRILAVKAKLFR